MNICLIGRGCALLTAPICQLRIIVAGVNIALIPHHGSTILWECIGK